MVHHSSEGETRRRKAAVAGSFYPGEASQLKRLLASVIDRDAAKTRAFAVVSPHAGYIYSGRVAGAVFSSVELPDLFVILGPSHRPIRPLFAAMVEGVWETPLGSIPVEKTLAARILEGSKTIVADAAAHAGEHSLEVQLPFLQYLRPDLGIVPISVSSGASYPDLEDLGRSIAAGIKALGRKVLIVASTDMSHYVSREEARFKDFRAIQKIVDLDPRGLFEVVTAERISMCGFQPVAAALLAARDLGATKGELVSYATSGDVTGDDREVVGYAGLRIL